MFGDYNERDYVDPNFDVFPEERNTNPMHKYAARGSFSDPALLRQTYGDVFNTQNQRRRSRKRARVMYMPKNNYGVVMLKLDKKTKRVRI